MNLAELTRDLPVDQVSSDIDITGISADSRTVRPGFLFAAIAGSNTDGAGFVGHAIAAGAAAILADAQADISSTDIPVLRAKDPRRVLALAAARLFPLQPQNLVAVTGTSGKTSVAVFARQIFERAGHRAASIGTIGVVGPAGEEPGSLTTPDPVALHQLLDRLARTDQVTHAALEASSHGLDQRRLDGLRLVAAGFTNLGRDHLDYHHDAAAYLAAKLRLFRNVLGAGGTAVVNTESDVAVDVIAAIEAARSRLMLVGRGGADIRVVSVHRDGVRQMLNLEVLGRPVDVALPLAGGFQVENAVMAAGLAIAAGVDPDRAIAALERIRGAPGRLERIADTKEGAAIFVDYAHKPEAIGAMLSALRPMTEGRLIIVLGAGGDRDAGKRPLMGKVASELADIVVVTDDNPRNEDPAVIRAEILAGANGAIEIGGREAAIFEAVGMLRAGDVLCVAGKGHETGQTIAGQTVPFSDRDVVTKALAAQ